MKRKKILFLNFEMSVGGIERSLLGLLNALDAERYEMDLFLFKHRGEFLEQIPPGVRLLPEKRAYALYCEPIGTCLRKGAWGLAAARLAAKAVTRWTNRKEGSKEMDNRYSVRFQRWCLPFLEPLEGEYDAVVSFQTPHYVALERCRGQVKIGFVHTDYGVLDVDVADEMPMWTKLDRVMGVSAECCAVFESVFPALTGRVLVLENVLSQHFVRQQALLADVGAEMPAQSGVVRLCSVGRFCTAKAFDDAIRSAALLKGRGLRFVWYFIGFGPDEALMRSLIGELGLENECVILGKKVNPYPYMQAATIYVQPSRFEGKAVTVREAQMLARPVLITRYATAESQVEQGVDGVICERSVEGVARALEDLMVHPELREQLSRNCRERDFGNTGEVRKLEQLLEQVTKDVLDSEDSGGTNRLMNRS